MGLLINSCSGASDVLGLPSFDLMSLLYNVPDAAESPAAVEKTKVLIENANPRVLIQDSGGFQLYMAETKGKPFMYDKSKPVRYNGVLNLTPEAVVTSAEIFAPHIVVSLDRPIPEKRGIDPLKRHLVFLQHHGFNLRCAKEISGLMQEKGLTSDFFVAVQCYTLEEVDMLFDDLGNTKYDGVCLPKRNHDPIEMALFFLKFYQRSVCKVHILGSTTFSRIAIAAYFAKHFMNFISMDTTNWRSDAELSKWYTPYDLRPIRLMADDVIDERIENTCSCPWCRGRSLTDIKNLVYGEQSSHLGKHNYWVVEQAMKEFQAHAATAKSLADFLMEKTSRKKEIADIYRCLSNIEIEKESLTNNSVSELHKYLCSNESDIE